MKPGTMPPEKYDRDLFAVWENEYLQTSWWNSRRALAMAAASGRCVVCQSRGYNTPAVDIHHLSYKHVWNELDCEVVALCRPCHSGVMHGYSGHEDHVDAILHHRLPVINRAYSTVATLSALSNPDDLTLFDARNVKAMASVLGVEVIDDIMCDNMAWISAVEDNGCETIVLPQRWSDGNNWIDIAVVRCRDKNILVMTTGGFRYKMVGSKHPSIPGLEFRFTT